MIVIFHYNTKYLNTSLNDIIVMFNKKILGTVIKDQLKDFENVKDTVPRSITKKILAYKGASAFVVKGLRRSGKSTLLKQVSKLKFDEDFYYFNFDDERVLGFEAKDLQTLMETFIELFGDRKRIILDEIQNVKGWELFVNRLLRQGYHVFITGSNAHLLSPELGTHLTGRHTDIELYPFSFKEFVISKGYDNPLKHYSTKEKAIFAKLFKEYLWKGGMPETVVFSNDSVLLQVINDIIQKDIVMRYNLRKTFELKAIIRFLLANISNPVTYNSLMKNFKIQSVNTVQKYIRYLEETYLIFTVHKYEKKLKKFDKNPKKIYCIDNGIVAKNAPSINERVGAMLENMIAVHLKRLGKEFYYFKDEYNAECDFVLPADKKAIQVCYELNQSNKSRELNGLSKVMDFLKIKKGLILTFEQQDMFKFKGKTVSVEPAWQWLLDSSL